MRVKIEKTKCTGCHICEMTCSAHHLGEINIFRSACPVPQADVIPLPPLICIQCKNALCVTACPTQALSQGKYWVEFDPNLCTKCGSCFSACKFNGIHPDPVNGFPIKCDMCGGKPMCVIQCPSEALSTI